jgi:hypothetical protein
MALDWIRLYFRKMKINIITLLSRSASARVLRHLPPVFACCGALGLLAGCASGPESHVVSAPPPSDPTRSVTTTTTTVGNPAYVAATTATPIVSTTIVTEAPPALQSEVVLAQPSAKDVWVAGYWTWRDQQYEWMAGRWELPPNSRSVWVSPRWEQQGNAYKFYEGYWN